MKRTPTKKLPLARTRKFKPHGWTVTRQANGVTASEFTLGVGRLPGCKQYALYVSFAEPSSIYPLAYFTTEARAHMALDAIDQLAGGR